MRGRGGVLMVPGFAERTPQVEKKKVHFRTHFIFLFFLPVLRNSSWRYGGQCVLFEMCTKCGVRWVRYYFSNKVKNVQREFFFFKGTIKEPCFCLQTVPSS